MTVQGSFLKEIPTARTDHHLNDENEVQGKV